ncbi:MAG: DUF6036 family nucleotidyltransferase [Candidatus Acidiferrales bacterium]
MPHKLISPWREFLEDLDALLDESLCLHCIGGFAVIVGYGLPRSTNDLDYRSLIPGNRVRDLENLAGHGSALARKHKIQLHYTGIDSMPENYEERLTELFPGHFVNLRLAIPDPYDLVLSKLGRDLRHDREDVRFLANSKHLDPAILRDRYVKELRPILIGPESRHDATLEYWLEDCFRKP